MNPAIERAWAEHVRQIKAEVLADIPRGVGVAQGEITAVAAPAADGRRYVSVRFNSKTVNNVLCNADLPVAVGNQVVVHLYDTDPVVAFRLTTS